MGQQNQGEPIFANGFSQFFLAIFAMIATKTKFMTLSEGWKR